MPRATLSGGKLTVAALRPRTPNQKVVGLDVTVDQVLFVYALNPRDLEGNGARRADTEDHVSQRDQEGGEGRKVGNGGYAHHLPGGHADGFDGEFSATHVEEIFETGPQKVDDENVVQALLTKVVDLRDTGCFAEKQVMGQLNAKLNK